MCANSLNEKDEWISHIAGVKGKFTAFAKSSSPEGTAVLGGAFSEELAYK